jgi:D-alanyl-D-alanine dipeptidase
MLLCGQVRHLSSPRLASARSCSISEHEADHPNGHQYVLPEYFQAISLDSSRLQPLMKLPIAFANTCILAVLFGASSAVVIAGVPSGSPIPPEPSAVLMRWVGQYGSEDSLLTIYEEHGRLRADGMKLHRVKLTPRGPTAYSVQTPGSAGNDSSMELSLDHGRPVAIRLDGVRLPRIDVGAQLLEHFRATRSDALALRTAALQQRPPIENGPRRPSDLVDLASDPRIKLDIRYATTNNFMGFALYESPNAYLQRPAAEALSRAAQRLAQDGFGLLVHDAYRPWFVTKMFWDATPESAHIFVANPAEGSRHNRGCAVDLTLYRLSTGQPVTMTGRYDEMSPRSYADFVGGTSAQRALRDLLRQAMEAEGFTVYAEEWWHFDYKDWNQYAIGNATFAQLQATANPR